MRDQKMLSNSFYHYKYTKTESIISSLGNRSSRIILRFSNDQWNYRKHEFILAATEKNNFFENVTYKVHRERHVNKTTKIDYQLENFGYYVSLTCAASFSGGSHFESILDVEVMASEYKNDIKTINFFSDLFEIEDNKFSIVLPLSTQNMPNGKSESTATLSLIHNATVKTYDPYTFTEDDNLRKLNAIPYGVDKIELLFLLK